MKNFRDLLGNRRVVGLISVNLLLVLLAVVTFNEMFDARENAVDRAVDAVDCQRAAYIIESLHNHGAGTPIIPGYAVSDITRRVDEAREDSALIPANIQGISPQPPSRLGNSAYSEVSTQIALVDVTLKQMLSFIDSLCPTASGLRLTAFHLGGHASDTATTQPEGGKWTADLTVASTSAAQLQSGRANKP